MTEGTGTNTLTEHKEIDCVVTEVLLVCLVSLPNAILLLRLSRIRGTTNTVTEKLDLVVSLQTQTLIPDKSSFATDTTDLPPFCDSLFCSQLHTPG